DLLLCFLERIGYTIERKALFSIINHECCPRVAIAGLPHPSRVNNCTVSLWGLPVSLMWKQHFICDIDHALAQAQKTEQLFNFCIQTLFCVLDSCFWRLGGTKLCLYNHFLIGIRFVCIRFIGCRLDILLYWLRRLCFIWCFLCTCGHSDFGIGYVICHLVLYFCDDINSLFKRSFF